MDFDQIASAVGRQFMTAWNAPIPFLAALLLAGFIIWWYIQREYARRLTNAASDISSLERRVQEYEAKLSGASPDEARARMEQLEAEVAQLRPRKLTGDQVGAIQRVAKEPGELAVVADGASPDARPFANGLALAFSGAGWAVRTPITFGLANPPPTGLAVVVADRENLRPEESAVIDALREAGLRFEVQSGAVHVALGGVVALHVTSPAL